MSHEPQAPGPAGPTRAHAPLGGRFAVGAVAALVAVAAWAGSAVVAYLAMQSDVAIAVPRGFPGIGPDREASLRLVLEPLPWLALLVLAGVVMLVVVAATSRGRAGSRAAAFFSGWFAAVLAAAPANLIGAVSWILTLAGSGDPAFLIASHVASGAYWGLLAGWLVGIVAAVGTGMLPAPGPADAGSPAPLPGAYPAG